MIDKTFAGIDLTQDNPPGICPDCAIHGLEHAQSGAVFVYCEHMQTGAFRRPGASWVRREHINGDDFERAILFGVLKFEKVFIDGETEGMTRQ